MNNLTLTKLVLFARVSVPARDWSSSQLGLIEVCWERPCHTLNHNMPELKFSSYAKMVCKRSVNSLRSLISGFKQNKKQKTPHASFNTNRRGGFLFHSFILG